MNKPPQPWGCCDGRDRWGSLAGLLRCRDGTLAFAHL